MIQKEIAEIINSSRPDGGWIVAEVAAQNLVDAGFVKIDGRVAELEVAIRLARSALRTYNPTKRVREILDSVINDKGMKK